MENVEVGICPSTLVEEGRVHRSVYTSAAVFQSELDRIWYRDWLLVGHVAELPEPGSYVTRRMGRQPVIVCRDRDGRVRVLLNSCTHRGATVLRPGYGRARAFVCMYHGWTFGLDGRLASVPMRDHYGPEFREEAMGLKEVARVALYRGLIFASFSDDVPPIETHLGEARRFVDMALTDDIEVLGTMEYEYRGNWKFHMENTIDGLHGIYLHRLFGNSGLLSSGNSLDLGNGHAGLMWRAEKAKGESGRLMGLDTTDTSPDTSRTIVLFPNTGLVHIQDLINLRIVMPIAADRTRVFTAALGRRSDTPELRARRASQLSAVQGPAGAAGADDIEVFEALQEGCAARAPEIDWLDFSRGARGSSGDLTDETGVRGCYRRWKAMMAVSQADRGRST